MSKKKKIEIEIEGKAISSISQKQDDYISINDIAKTNNINKCKTPPDERYLGNLEKHIERAQEAEKYSADRFDILLISLSSTALALSIGFVNNVVPDLKATDTSLLKTSWLLFVLTLISNLTSQVSGYYAHVYDIKTTRNIIREERGKNHKGNQKKF